MTKVNKTTTLTHKVKKKNLNQIIYYNCEKKDHYTNTFYKPNNKCQSY